MKYRVCPDCGLNIDFGEICECKKQRVEKDKNNDINAARDALINKNRKET